MKQIDLPERWQKRLSQWIRENSQDSDEMLSAYDFTNSKLLIKFEDGSNANFEYAFAIEDSELREVGVFTEHCGYHIFPLSGTEIFLIEK